MGEDPRAPAVQLDVRAEGALRGDRPSSERRVRRGRPRGRSKGVRLMLTPGHSPGGQSVVVDTDDGTYVIAGMCTIRDNFYPPEEVLAKGTYKVIPAGHAHGSDPLLRLDAPDPRRRQGQGAAVPRRRRARRWGRSAEAGAVRLPRARDGSRRPSSCWRASAATRRRSPAARASVRCSTCASRRRPSLVDLNGTGRASTAFARRTASCASARSTGNARARAATRSCASAALSSPRRCPGSATWRSATAARSAAASPTPTPRPSFRPSWPRSTRRSRS